MAENKNKKSRITHCFSESSKHASQYNHPDENRDPENQVDVDYESIPFCHSHPSLIYVYKSVQRESGKL